MSKFLLILIAGAIAALVLGGVLEVKVHPGNLAQVPQKVAGLAKDAGTWETIRTGSINLKRKAEQWIIKDEHQRFEVALLYVEKDSQRLKELLESEGSWEPNKLVGQAGLLATSLERIEKQSETVPVDVMASLKGKTSETLASAEDAFKRFKDFQTNYEELKDKLAKTTEFLEKQIGKFRGGEDAEEEPGEVAGTQTEPVPTPTPAPEPTSTIPLRF